MSARQRGRAPNVVQVLARGQHWTPLGVHVPSMQSYVP